MTLTKVTIFAFLVDPRAVAGLFLEGILHPCLIKLSEKVYLLKARSV